MAMSGNGNSGGGATTLNGSSTQNNTPMCPSFVGARVARLTRLNSCGAPMYGRENVATTIGMVTATFEPEVEEGEALDTKNLNGQLCVSGSTPSTMSGINVSIEFCQVDPAVFSIMNPNWKVVRNSRDDYSGRVTGFRIGQNFGDEFGFALELWPKTMGQTGSACEAEQQLDPSDPMVVNGYFLLPFVYGRAPEEWEITGDEVATFTLNGRTRGGSSWDVGPYVVTRDESGTPSPLLRPIEDGSGKAGFKHPVTGQIMRDPDHFHAEIVTVTPPEAQCGAQPLIKPEVKFIQDGRTVTAILLNADEIAPKDPITGERPPVWVSWGDGTPRTNLTAPEHESDCTSAGDQDDEDDSGDTGGGQDQQPQVTVTQDQRDPRRVTAQADGLSQGQELTVDWGGKARQVGQSPQVTVSQDPANPKRVTAEAQQFPPGVDELTVDWGAAARETGGGGNGEPPVQFSQDPASPRTVTADATPWPEGTEEITVDWGGNAKEQQQ